MNDLCLEVIYSLKVMSCIIAVLLSLNFIHWNSAFVFACITKIL